MAHLNDEDREALTAYLDGELDEAAARSVETRLNLDPKTRAEAEAIKQAWSLLDYLPRAEPSATFTHRTLERLALQTGMVRRPAWRPWVAGLAWAGAVLAAAAVGFFVALLLWRSPPEASNLEDPLDHRLPDIDEVRLKNLREDEWLNRQPAAFRAKLLKLSADQRAEAMKDRRIQEAKARVSWQIAARFWDDLTRDKRSLPHQLADFLPDVQSFVKQYLVPRLGPDELNALRRAEGNWPEYPMELVALADRHPPALPDSRGPKKVEDLPEEILRRLFKGKADKHKPQLRNLNEKAVKIGLGRAVAQRAKEKPPDGVILPHELWPYRQKCLSQQVQDFIKGKLLPLLTPDEKLALVEADAQGFWPDYPLKLKELAENHGLRVPWQTLPGPAQLWDRYRITPYFAADQKAPRSAP